jgi:hypothetical protein
MIERCKCGGKAVCKPYIARDYMGNMTTKYYIACERCGKKSGNWPDFQAARFDWNYKTWRERIVV